MATEEITLKLERDGYRLTLGPAGFVIETLRNFNQYDERQYERCLRVPLDDLPALGALIEDFHKRAAELGLATAPEHSG